MSSKIPRPVVAVLQPLTENTNISNKKRKVASPDKAPAAKGNDVANTSGLTTNTILCEDTIAAPREELEQWAMIASETGWVPTDCLSHKISFPKRCDAAKKVETLGAHIKKLRAVGWHLFDERAQTDSNLSRVEQELKRIKAEREAEHLVHEEAQLLAKVHADDLQKDLDSSKSQLALKMTEIDKLRDQLTETHSKLNHVEAARDKVTADLASQQTAAETLQKKLETAETLAIESQKYSAQLQEYNLKLQSDLAAATESATKAQEEKAALAEEAASLRGRVDALGDALSALQAINRNNESVRQAAAEEAVRLRADLASACAEKASLAADVGRLRSENEEYRKDLERFKVATGKDLAALEAEKASSAALANRTQAQAATVAALQDQVALLKEQRAAAEAQAESRVDAVRTLTARVAELETLLAAAEQRVREGEATRRRLHNTILELKGNIRVFCRVRPPNQDYKESKASVLECSDQGELAGRGLELVQNQPGTSSSKGPQKHVFTFDRVLGPSSTQREVFEEVSALVQSALDGYRVTLFAYGQTGAGKTHTIIGSPGPETEGIIPRAVRQVFSTAAAATEQGWRYEMRAAMLEIYNEEINDLLGSGPPPGKKHTIIHEDKEKGGATTVSFLEWIHVDDEAKVTSLLSKAMASRAVGATASNDQSSRSHMVFMLTIEGYNETTSQKLSGTLNLVDLAGSERLAKSGASGERLKETQAINKSLSALGDVISALGAREAHIPYRNSKLTYLLQNSLGGNGKALMMCNVSPCPENAAESLCTLRFAAKVNATEIGIARRNVK